MHAGQGLTLRRTTSRHTSWRRCSARTSISLLTTCPPRFGRPVRKLELPPVPVRGRPRPALDQHPPRGRGSGGDSIASVQTAQLSPPTRTSNFRLSGGTPHTLT